MQIKNRLAIYFTIISSALMLLVMVVIYLLFSQQTVRYFYNELHERTEVAAQLYLEADEISNTSLKKIHEKFLVSLPHEVIRMYDSSDQQAFIDEAGKNWGRSTIDMVRKQKYMEYRDGDRQMVGIDYDDNQGNFVILASAVDVAGSAKRRYLLQLMVTMFVVQLLVQFVAGRWLASRLLLPIQRINSKVKKITATDLHLRVPVENEKDELGVLAGNFNGLLQRLEESFDLQKMFVANASHELRTPITNIMGEADVALSRVRTPGEYQQVLASILAEADRMNDVTRSFLLLANAEANRSQAREQVRIDDLLWELQDIYGKGNRGQIEIRLADMPENTDVLCLHTNKTFLSVAIGNIIQNGIKFSDGKPVICTLHAGSNGLSVSIEDHGIGMSAETIRNIFEPFYRSADSKGYPGHGIGLYIAYKLVQILGGDITVQSEPGRGSTFNISFTRHSVF